MELKNISNKEVNFMDQNIAPGEIVEVYGKKDYPATLAVVGEEKKVKEVKVKKTKIVK